jgi:hypothetical protein
MEKASIIGVDLAKHVFQVHGACADGSCAVAKPPDERRDLLIEHRDMSQQ